MSGTGGLAATWEQAVVVVDVRRHDGRPSVVSRLAAALADHVAVLLVVPVDLGARPDRGARSTLLHPRLAQLVTPVTALGRGALGPLVDAALLRRSVRSALRDLGDPSVRAVLVPPLIHRADPVDADLRVLVAGADILDGWALPGRGRAALERHLARAVADADLVVAGSPALAAVLDGTARVTVIPEGVDDEVLPFRSSNHHRGPGRAAGAGRDVVGVVGDLAADVDVDALAAVAGAGHELLLVGRGPTRTPASDLARLLRRPDVTWVGPRPPHEVRALVGSCRIGVIALRDTPYTRARLPLDALAHLAAGQPVVATACETARWLRGDGSDRGGLDGDDVLVAVDHAELADLVGRATSQPTDPVAAARRRRVARGHRWSVRGAELAQAIGVGAPAAVTS